MDLSQDFDGYAVTDLKIHDSIMNSLIKKYNPFPNAKDGEFDASNITKEGI